MDRTVGVVLTLCMAFGTVLAIVAMLLEQDRTKRNPASEPPASPPQPSRTSPLAGFGFFLALVAILMVTASGILSACASMNEITRVPDSVRAALDLAAKIVRYVSLLPAVGAVAMALAARGSIQESGGRLGGKALYRSAFLLSMLSGLLAFKDHALDPAGWVAVGGAGGAGGAGSMMTVNIGNPDPDQGWLGIESAPPDPMGVRIVRVIPGSPAERAGLQAGDYLVDLDGTRLTEDAPLRQRLGGLKPGTSVKLGVLREGVSSVLTAELGTPFSTLLKMVTDESNDDGRLLVLKAAGAERRYTAVELVQVCAAFDHDVNRLTVIEPALRLLVDPQNAFQILGCLDRPDSKRTVSDWIAARARSPK